MSRGPDPLAADADELGHLRAWLDRHRATLRRLAEGLDDEQLRATHPPSTLSLAALLKHLTFVEDHWVRVVLDGGDYPEPWAGRGGRRAFSWAFTSAASDGGDDLRELHRAACAASDQVLDGLVSTHGSAAVAQPTARGVDGSRPATVRWILQQLLTEYARHCGHADLTRESIDGATGL